MGLSNLIGKKEYAFFRLSFDMYILSREANNQNVMINNIIFADPGR